MNQNGPERDKVSEPSHLPKLEPTGERFMPEISGNIYLEHMHRYMLTAPLVKGARVLDIASGEGFGSNILAQSAAEVIGVDISEAAILNARAKYARNGLRFEVGSVTAIPLPDHSVDFVISFETIEHIAAHQEMLAEVRRVLRPGGVFVCSTPEKAVYTDASGHVNPFHVKELYRAEFETLLGAHFDHFRMHGQKINFGSVIVPDVGSVRFSEIRSETGEATPGQLQATYMIAIASDDPGQVQAIGGIFSQDIQASEPVAVRVAFERGVWRKETEAQLEPAMEELSWVSHQIGALQRTNSMSRANLPKLIKRLVVTRLLYWLSAREIFSEKHRRQFRRSAEKRDPMLLARRMDSFCHEFLHRVNSNAKLGEARKALLHTIGLTVTAIVPSYNHAPFLRQRLDSILNQSYALIDVIILDDASTDDSRAIIAEYAARFPNRIRAVLNETNSGSVFAQWQKGHDLATGDLVWFCESDDFAESDFVERLIGSFRDPSVMLAFGRIEFADAQGQHVPGLDHYRESAEAGIWSEGCIRPAASWFSGGFGVKNVIANVGGSLWRRVPISQAVWDTARSYRIMGDWFLYSEVAQGGQIAFEPSAVAYFRSHDTNTSGQGAQAKPEYYREYARLMTALKRRWDIPDVTVDRFVAQAAQIFRKAKVQGAEFDALVNGATLKAVKRDVPHVLLGILGFSYGGGEIFPIHLANALRAIGTTVSVLQMSDLEDHADVRAMLDPSIPVYGANVVRDMGGNRFLRDAGISIIHSHLASVEMLMLEKESVDGPYLATLHGSYEAMEIPRSRATKWAERVDQYAYTAERNLSPFDLEALSSDKFVKFRNAMPIDPRDLPQSRADRGIPADATVFTLVARGIEGKGWEEAV
ncbi:MAG: glycosyltransferase, partial [Novosphingobium sp.]